MQNYYFVNQIWVYGNAVMIPPFIISCICRYRRPQFNKSLWTDHLARIFLILTVIFYIFDMTIKYPIDGAHSICQKAFYIHHIGSIIILPPLIVNSYIPWWACPIGFVHGFCINFPEIDTFSYIYAVCLFIFQYGIYQQPYSKLKYYKVIRVSMNFIWVFVLLLLVGDCSNYLPCYPITE